MRSPVVLVTSASAGNGGASGRGAAIADWRRCALSGVRFSSDSPAAPQLARAPFIKAGLASSRCPAAAIWSVGSTSLSGTWRSFECAGFINANVKTALQEEYWNGIRRDEEVPP